MITNGIRILCFFPAAHKERAGPDRGLYCIVTITMYLKQLKTINKPWLGFGFRTAFSKLSLCHSHYVASHGTETLVTRVTDLWMNHLTNPILPTFVFLYLFYGGVWSMTDESLSLGLVAALLSGFMALNCLPDSSRVNRLWLVRELSFGFFRVLWVHVPHFTHITNAQSMHTNDAVNHQYNSLPNREPCEEQ